MIVIGVPVERGKKETLRRVPMRQLVSSVKKDIQRIVKNAAPKKSKKR